MSSSKDYDVTVGSGIISIFQRQAFRLDRVFSEFIDNSLQSFLDHENALKELPDGQKCKVYIEWNKEKIVVKDNAFGMNDEEFGRALKLKSANPNAKRNGQLGIFGMGLKYASVYLGDHYSISSTAYGSGVRYFAEVDVPEFEKDNPNTVTAKLLSESPEVHETVLTITHLRIKKTPDRERDLREKLGLIFNHYIQSGKVSIILNGCPVIYQRPELRPNAEGGKYYENFEGSFSAGDKVYAFTGWIGVLNKGDQSITGLCLVQADRCIELGYKPEKLFGKGNSFQNSRVIGEVVFGGENYVLSFNKDKFVWADDGAEDAFIDALVKNEKIASIIKASKTLSFTDDKEKIKEKTNKMLKSSGVITAKAEPDSSLKKPAKIETLSIDCFAEKKPTVVPETEYQKFAVKVNDKTIPLYFSSKNGGPSDAWITLEKHEDGYLIQTNFGNRFINDNLKTQAAKAASDTLAILLGTSMLRAQDLGLKLSDSLKLLETLNKQMDGKNE